MLWSISSSAISTSTLYNLVLVCLPCGLLASTLYSTLFFTQSSSLFLITCSYHLSLPLLMTVVICSTPTNSLNSSFVILSFMETPHIHLIICCICVLLKYTSGQVGLGVGSWPSNRATEGSNPKEPDYTS